MVVDDSMLARRLIKPILTNAGHEVVREATNGADAIQGYRECRPQVVTMDIIMPGVDGIAAAKRILGEFPDARIVMVTSMRDERHVLEALDLGAASYIVKPYTNEKVLKAIDDVLTMAKA